MIFGVKHMNYLNTIPSGIFDLLKRYWLLIAILAVLFIVSGFGPNLALLGLSFFLTYKLAMRIVSAKIADSNVFVAVISIFFYVLMLQSVSLVTWLLSHSFPLSLNIFFTFLFITTVYVFLRRYPVIARRRKFVTGDMISIGVVLVTLVIFVGLPVRNTNIHDKSGLLVLANYNVDDGGHLGLLNARLQYNVATTVDNKADTSAQQNGGVSYPAGWPAANAAIIQAFAPSIQVGSSTLIAYILIKIFWLVVLVFVFTRSIFALYGLFAAKPLQLPSLAWISISATLFTAWFLVDPFFYGFFSFIPQLITIPLFILSLIQLTTLGKKSEKLLLTMMVPIILCIGAALSWFLLFPVFIAALSLCLINRATQISLKAVLKELTLSISRYLVFYVVIILSLFSQLYIVLSTSSTGASTTLIHSLLLNGGINIYPASLYTVIAVGVILFLALIVIKNHIDKLKAVLNYAVAMLGFASFIYAIQLYKINENFYYYFKTLNTVTIVGIMFAIVGIALAINLVQSKSSKYIAVVITIIIGLLLLQFAYPGAPMFRYAHGVRAINASVDKQIFSILDTHNSPSKYTDGVVTVFYPSSNLILNEVASTLIQANKPYSKCYATVKAASFSVPISSFSVSPVLEGCEPSNHVVYYAEQEFVASMKQKIADANLSDRITVLSIKY